jgi:hypothetical protein
MVTGLLAGALLILIAAEAFHIRACVRQRDLLFHGCEIPWFWIGLLSAMRILGFILLLVGTSQLWRESMHPAKANTLPTIDENDRLLILLDASLSMDLRDAGPEGDISRGERAAEIIQELVLGGGRGAPRTTLVVFAETALPLAVDTNDWNVIRHSLNNRNLSEFLFKGRKTTIGAVVSQTLKEFAGKWPPRSTVLVLITDGDSDDPVRGVPLPRSIRRTLVIGVGSEEGRPIGNFQSRHDERVLREMARELGGTYYNGTRELVPAAALERPPLTAGELARQWSLQPRQIAPRSNWALALLGTGISLLGGAFVVGQILDPSVAKPLKHEKPVFLS